MFNKKNLNKMKFYASAVLCATTVFIAPATSLISYASEPASDVEVCAHIIEWRYKIEDGKLYKALYNYSIGEFISDWEYVCDYPEGI